MPQQANLCVLGIYPKNFIVSSRQMTLIDFPAGQENDSCISFTKCMGGSILYYIGETNVHNQRKGRRIKKKLRKPLLELLGYHVGHKLEEQHLLLYKLDKKSHQVTIIVKLFRGIIC